ncbi:hypothetical protein AMS66_07785 [Paenibacillus xylanivorans]|uniref:Uncharacterized protein n=1 Tax=Paenibacillus xylanivorans TaxID=1705561 RepID=A0A0N0C551_9BACL|nr:hypothetical protein AMS66_07785 [Paenibacillus xylanivorans]
MEKQKEQTIHVIETIERSMMAQSAKSRLRHRRKRSPFINFNHLILVNQQVWYEMVVFLRNK